MSVHVLLGNPEVSDHLEGRLKLLVVELGRGVRKLEYKGFVAMVLAHKLTEHTLHVDQVTFLLELRIGTTARDGHFSASTPLFHETLDSI